MHFAGRLRSADDGDGRGPALHALHSQGWPESARLLAHRLFASLVASADDPDLGPADLNRIAWTLVADVPTNLRDPALALALRACSLESGRGGKKLWMYLDALPGAQHATGDCRRRRRRATAGSSRSGSGGA